MDGKEIEYVIFHELYDGVVQDAVLKIFNSDIRRDYYVSGLAQMGDRWVVKLSRSLMPKIDAERE